MWEQPASKSLNTTLYKRCAQIVKIFVEKASLTEGGLSSYNPCYITVWPVEARLSNVTRPSLSPLSSYILLFEEVFFNGAVFTAMSSP